MTEKGGDIGRGSKIGKYYHILTFPPQAGGNRREGDIITNYTEEKETIIALISRIMARYIVPLQLHEFQFTVYAPVCNLSSHLLFQAIQIILSAVLRNKSVHINASCLFSHFLHSVQYSALDDNVPQIYLSFWI